MKPRWHQFGRWTLLLLLGGHGLVLAQSWQRAEEPRFLRLRIMDASLVVEAERRYQKQTITSTQESYTDLAESLAPAADLTLNGAIYHPNLLEFTFRGQLGYEWEKIDSITATNGGGNSVLQNYDLRLNLLKEKPYAATLTGGKSTYVREYDFFNTVHGDSQRFGGSAGYTEGLIPFTVEANRAETTADSEPAPSMSRYDTVYLSARNLRRKNHTEFTYGYTQYLREYTGQSLDEGSDHSVQVHDTEVWGADKPAVLTSRLTYHYTDNAMSIMGTDPLAGDINTTRLLSSGISLQEHLEKPHSAALRSLYDYSLDNYRQEDYRTLNQRGQVGVIHQLFESLTSSADLHAGLGHSSGSESSWDNTYYGLGLGENYAKRLGQWGQLHMGFQGTFDRQDNQTTGGNRTIPVFQERHTLTDGVVTFLNLAQADPASIRVTDAAGLITYREFFDYEVIPQGDLVEIKRITGGIIPNGSTVLVDYRVSTDGSAKGELLTDTFHIRLDLFQGLLSLYSRLTQNKNFGDSWQNAQDSLDKVAGLELSALDCSAMAEYEVYESDQTAYNATRLAQSVSLPLDSWGHMGLTASENWTYFPNTDQHRNTFQLIARYSIQLSSTVDFSIEGGQRIERGDTDDRDLATARAELNCQIADLTLKLTYEYEGQTTLEDTRERNRVYLRVKRAF